MIPKEALRRDPKFTAMVRDDLMKLEVLPIEYIVDGLVLSGSSTLFSAREKAGKGLLLIDLAICIATGTPFLSRSVTEGPAVYMALEENVATI